MFRDGPGAPLRSYKRKASAPAFPIGKGYMMKVLMKKETINRVIDLRKSNSTRVIEPPPPTSKYSSTSIISGPAEPRRH